MTRPVCVTRKTFA